MAARFHAYPFAEPATGLVYARARWFDPGTGSFLSPDPMGYQDSSNLYAFGGGDPVNRRDPLGTDDVEATGSFASSPYEFLIQTVNAGATLDEAYEALRHSSFAGSYDENELALQVGIVGMARKPIETAAEVELAAVSYTPIGVATNLVLTMIEDPATGVALAANVLLRTTQFGRFVNAADPFLRMHRRQTERSKTVLIDPAARRPKVHVKTKAAAFDEMVDGKAPDTKLCPDCGNAVQKKDVQIDHGGKEGPWVVRQERARDEGWTREEVTANYQVDVRGICKDCNQKAGGKLGAERKAKKNAGSNRRTP